MEKSEKRRDSDSSVQKQLEDLLVSEYEKRVKFKKVILVCGQEEKAYLEGDSFVADAIKQFKVDVEYIGLTPEQESLLLSTAKKQDLSKS